MDKNHYYNIVDSVTPMFDNCNDNNQELIIVGASSVLYDLPSLDRYTDLRIKFIDCVEGNLLVLKRNIEKYYSSYSNISYVLCDITGLKGKVIEIIKDTMDKEYSLEEFLQKLEHVRLPPPVEKTQGYFISSNCLTELTLNVQQLILNFAYIHYRLSDLNSYSLFEPIFDRLFAKAVNHHLKLATSYNGALIIVSYAIESRGEGALSLLPNSFGIISVDNLFEEFDPIKLWVWKKDKETELKMISLKTKGAI